MLPRVGVGRPASTRCSTSSGIVDPSSPRRPEPGAKRGHVEFENVTFPHYPGAEEPALTSVSFAALPGEGGDRDHRLAPAQGQVRSAGLIPRFYDVAGGAVLVDGVDVREMAQVADLRARIGYVPAEGVASSPARSRRTSATAAGTATDADVRHRGRGAGDRVRGRRCTAVRVADLAGRATSPADRNSGCRSRGRSCAADVYVFDDSFALNATDAKVARHAQGETAQATVFIAQRIGSIITADRIVVTSTQRPRGRHQHARGPAREGHTRSTAKISSHRRCARGGRGGHRPAGRRLPPRRRSRTPRPRLRATRCSAADRSPASACRNARRRRTSRTLVRACSTYRPHRRRPRGDCARGCDRHRRRTPGRRSSARRRRRCSRASWRKRARRPRRGRGLRLRRAAFCSGSSSSVVANAEFPVSDAVLMANVAQAVYALRKEVEEVRAAAAEVLRLADARRGDEPRRQRSRQHQRHARWKSHAAADVVLLTLIALDRRRC